MSDAPDRAAAQATTGTGSEPLVRIRGLQTRFELDTGIARAVRGLPHLCSKRMAIQVVAFWHGPARHNHAGAGVFSREPERLVDRQEFRLAGEQFLERSRSFACRNRHADSKQGQHQHEQGNRHA